MESPITNSPVVCQLSFHALVLRVVAVAGLDDKVKEMEAAAASMVTSSSGQQDDEMRPAASRQCSLLIGPLCGFSVGWLSFSPASYVMLSKVDVPLDTFANFSSFLFPSVRPELLIYYHSSHSVNQ